MPMLIPTCQVVLLVQGLQGLETCPSSSVFANSGASHRPDFAISIGAVLTSDR